MGYGTGQATFNIGIAETDVQAIIDGLTGSNGQTLTELEYRLANVEGNLNYNGNSAAAFLQWINDNVSSVSNYLAGSYYGVLYDGTSAVTYLNWIASNTGSFGSYLYDGNSAVSYLNWISSNTGNLSSYLWSGNASMSAADLLNDIRSLLWNFQFDGNGRLLVSTN